MLLCDCKNRWIVCISNIGIESSECPVKAPNSNYEGTVKSRSDSSDPAPGSDAPSRCQGGCLHVPATHIFNFEKSLCFAQGAGGNLLKELKLLTGKTVLFFLLKTSINFRLLLLITRKVKSLHPLAK